VARRPLPPIAVVISFIDGINRADLRALADLMTDDHTLRVLDEEPLVGRGANVDAWDGYFSSFPDYVIHPRWIAATDGRVAVLGATTGSHLRLPDHEERRLDVIWRAEVVDGRVSEWRICEDGPELRSDLGLSASA
jgi:ketosteroid isomerase-like protein